MAMNEITPERVAARYDGTLHRGHHSKFLPGVTKPQFTAVWPEENIALLARYCIWLQEEDSTPNCIEQIYLPMAGHILGLNLKPHAQLNLDSDLEKAMDYIRAKQLSPAWTDNCRRAMNRFCRFLKYARGLLDVTFDDVSVCVKRYQVGLPAWLIEQLTHFQHLRQANWRPSRLRQAIQRFWNNHTQVWRWLFAQDDIQELRDIKRRHLFAYIDDRLVARYATKSINQELRVFHATLRFLQEREYHVPLALLRLPFLKEPDSLPRFLTDEEVARVQMDLEQRVTQAEKTAQRRNALMDRATFYLMWHAGLRVSEVEELCLSNLNLGQRQISVRQGKGRKDRTVYLTDVTVKALQAYLAMRGQGRTEHLFVYRHKPLSKDLVRVRIKAAGQRTGVKVTPHQLRHTCATQLVNAGCQITTIQAMLGHRRLKSTMIYARVYDRTVAEDYYAAMTVIERRLELHLHGLPETGTSQKQQPQTFSNGTDHLLNLVDALNNGSLSDDQQQILTQLRNSILALG